jgi:hypothetical protein
MRNYPLKNDYFPIVLFDIKHTAKARVGGSIFERDDTGCIKASDAAASSPGLNRLATASRSIICTSPNFEARSARRGFSSIRSQAMTLGIGH